MNMYMNGRFLAGTCAIQIIYILWSTHRTLKTIAYHISCWRPAVQKRAKNTEISQESAHPGYQAIDDFSVSHLIVSCRSVVVGDSTSVPRARDLMNLRLYAC